MNQLFSPSALQCKNCGLRYQPTEMASYTQHLDWHFRVRRREKDNARRAQSRKWYFERLEWIISEEIEDEDSKGDGMGGEDGEDGGDRGASPSALKNQPSVPVDQDGAADNSSSASAVQCPVCNEEFEQFFKQDGTDDDDSDGRWHYRNAVRPVEGGGALYHPQCYQDYKTNGGGADSSRLEVVHEEEDAEVKVKVEEGSAEAAADDDDNAEKAQPMETDSQEQQQTVEVKQEPLSEMNDQEEANGTAQVKEDQQSVEGEAATAEDGEKMETEETEEVKKDDSLPTLDDVSSPTTATLAAPAANIKINITTQVSHYI